jgi:DNA-binding NarL/FixJ family response regulator
VSAVRVLAVDDQLIFRLALRRLIAATPGFEQVGEAASGEEALRLASDLRPDLGLVDVRMPGMDGFETARRLAGVDSELVIVLISIEEAAAAAPGFTETAVAAHVRKRDLSTRMLRELWARHGGGVRP